MVVVFKYLFIRFFSVQFEIIKNSEAKCQLQNFQKISQKIHDFGNSGFELIASQIFGNFLPKIIFENVRNSCYSF